MKYCLRVIGEEDQAADVELPPAADLVVPAAAPVPQMDGCLMQIGFDSFNALVGVTKFFQTKAALVYGERFSGGATVPRLESTLVTDGGHVRRQYYCAVCLLYHDFDSFSTSQRKKSQKKCKSCLEVVHER